MKIGFFGNTNNSPLMPAAALRDLGHDVLFFVTSRNLLNRPESRYPEYANGYPAWITDASNLSEWDLITLNPSLEPVLDALSLCDALVLNDIGPSLWPLLRHPAIILLTGSDLSHYANFGMVNVRTAGWAQEYRASVQGQMEMRWLQNSIERQREGIRHGVGVAHLPRCVVPENDAILDDIGVSDSKRLFHYFAELDLVKPVRAPHNTPLRIFSATRLTWKLPIEPGRSLLDYKGSDIMIRGLGMFFRQTGLRLDIRLIRKGLHCAETEQLIAEEGLTDQVNWLDEMSLSQVWSEFAHSDIVIEQLANSAIGMAGMDAMATGRPVIGNIRPEIFDGCFGQSVPICQAKTADEVYRQLKRLVFDPSEREKLGTRGRQFVEEHCSPRHAAQDYLKRLPSESECKSRRERNQAGHGYHKKKLYEYRNKIQSLQHTLQNTKAMPRTLHSYLNRYQSSPLIKLARKLSKLYKTKRSTN